MKKLFVLVLFTTLMVTACNSSTLSFSEIEHVPRNIDMHINSDVILQLINDGTKGSYIIFHSKADVEADLHVQDNIVNITFEERHLLNNDVKPNIYYLTTDAKHDTINVLVNGEEMPFDNVTGL